MKMNKLLTLLSVVMFLTTCKKDDNPYSGTATAIKDGEKWKAGTLASTSNAFKIEDGYIGINTKATSSNGFQEDLVFGKVPIKKGAYNLGIYSPPYTFSYVAAAYTNAIEDGHILTDA